MSDLMSEFRENGQVKPAKSNKIVELCGALSAMWEEGYSTSSDEEAKLTALEIVKICKSVSKELPYHLTDQLYPSMQIDHKGQL